MVEPAVPVNEGRADLLSILPFWSKYSVDPPFLWESWIGKFFMAVGLEYNIIPNDVLADSPVIADETLPKTETPAATEDAVARTHILHDQAAVRRNDEGNAERRQKRPSHCPELALP